MTLSKQLFSLLFLFLFRLLHASNPNKCPPSHSVKYLSNRCGPLEVPVRFPFCADARFNLHCNKLNRTVIELPIPGTFFVENIDYQKQQISISDPEECLVKRLLNFNTSGSPFSPNSSVDFTLTCPNETLKPSWSPSISCLSNSTTSFFATSNLALANSMLPSCHIVKRVGVPIKDPLEKNFSFAINLVDLLLEWTSPDCRVCEKKYLRCGFKNKKKVSSQVKCFSDKPGLPDDVKIFIPLSIIGAIAIISLFVMRCAASQRRRNVVRALRQQPREIVVIRGLDQSTIDLYKIVKLGESRKLPGNNNGIICPICLSEYASQDTVRCIPDCDHCFHVECIDPWLKIRGSCPICRISIS